MILPSGYPERMADISITLLLDDQHMGQPVDLADGTRFPKNAEVWATVDDTPVVLWLTVEDGHPVLVSLTISRGNWAKGPLKASTVHDIPVDQVVRQSVADIGRLMARNEGREPAPVRAYGRRSVNAELLRQVAEIVKSDRLGHPNEAVKNKLHCSSRTASRWIAAAREGGFLPQPEEG